MMPESVRAPALVAKVVSPVRVIGPENELVPDRLRRAPVPPSPTPVSVSDEGVMVREPSRLSVAPSATVNTVVEAAPLLSNCRFPAETSVEPAKLLFPASASRFEPCLSRPPGPVSWPVIRSEPPAIWKMLVPTIVTSPVRVLSPP